MTILYITYFLNGLLMILMPICLAIYLIRKFRQKWYLFWVGIATFLVSQVFHIPFNALISPLFSKINWSSFNSTGQILLNAIFLGLSAGIFEELSRYAMFRWVAKEARSWGKGLLAGCGHGGAEAILLGSFVIYGYFQMVALHNANLSTIIPAERLEIVREQVSAYWTAPWYMSLLGAAERLFTIPVHLACSIIVLQVFNRKQLWWVGLAIGFHALLDSLAVISINLKVPYYGTEAIIGVFALISLGVIFALKSPETKNEVSKKNIFVNQGFVPGPIKENEENLDNSRYQ
jgi:uncharacterized membrane protein YhfC